MPARRWSHDPNRFRAPRLDTWRAPAARDHVVPLSFRTPFDSLEEEHARTPSEHQDGGVHSDPECPGPHLGHEYDRSSEHPSCHPPRVLGWRVRCLCTPLVKNPWEHGRPALLTSPKPPEAAPRAPSPSPWEDSRDFHRSRIPTFDSRTLLVRVAHLPPPFRDPEMKGSEQAEPSQPFGRIQAIMPAKMIHGCDIRDGDDGCHGTRPHRLVARRQRPPPIPEQHYRQGHYSEGQPEDKNMSWTHSPCHPHHEQRAGQQAFRCPLSPSWAGWPRSRRVPLQVSLLRTFSHWYQLLLDLSRAHTTPSETRSALYVPWWRQQLRRVPTIIELLLLDCQVQSCQVDRVTSWL